MLVAAALNAAPTTAGTIAPRNPATHRDMRPRLTYALLIEERVYAPVASAALRGAGWARRLQSGRLSVYALYLTALLLALLALARFGLVG